MSISNEYRNSTDLLSGAPSAPEEIDLRSSAPLADIRIVPTPAADASPPISAIGSVRIPDTFYVRHVKYPLERVAAAVVFLLIFPLLLLVALAIRINMGPNVIFRQRRVGLDGEVFTMWKFRTMDPDRRRAEEPFAWPDRRVTHKSRDDPRLRKLGRILRATGLDEMPQLWDVVRGKMALIGPRPELESVVRKRDLWDHPRHLVKPGITGLWQVSPVRKDLMYENLHIDVDYVENISPTLDAKIAWATVFMPFRRTGW